MDVGDSIGLEAVQQVPRVLGMIDREKDSPTFGCADRYFWHYKLHDFPNARFQEAAEILALAFKYRHASNPFFGQERVRQWATAAIRFWEKIKSSDGSFDEAYPYERSFCATAFSSMHAARALILLEESPSADLQTVGRWLMRHDALDTANQRAASVAAMAYLSKISGNDRLRLSARSRAHDMVEAYERLNRFDEYGGSDTGYSSIALSALSLYDGCAQDGDLSAWIKTRSDEAGRVLRQDGSYEYEGQSRRTQFFYPFALAWTNHSSLEKISRGVVQNRILKPSWMDDRYMVPYAADYLRSACFSPA